MIEVIAGVEHFVATVVTRAAMQPKSRLGIDQIVLKRCGLWLHSLRLVPFEFVNRVQAGIDHQGAFAAVDAGV